MSSVLDLGDSRYHRQELITWWDQDRLRASRVLVVGAGALGNEIAKNLALVGIGHIEIVDMDTIEHSNLARCVFFRETDEGANKAVVLAREISALNTEVGVVAYDLPVQRLGIGFLQGFDLVIGALDNREARAWVNQSCRKLGKTWIDGAIEGLRGVARVFAPVGPCYMCTLGENDFTQMSHRKSCALLAPDEILSGKTPTNATTAAVIAAIQAQEAIKILVNRADLVALSGKGWVFTGDSMDSYVTTYREDEYCLDHDSYDDIRGPFVASTLIELAQAANVDLGDVVSVDFEEDVISFLGCPQCGGSPVTKVRSAHQLGAGVCPKCDAELPGSTTTTLTPSDELMGTQLSDFGFGKLDLVTFRMASNRLHILVEGQH
jgi:adenylyltransferase/sulfurtransferase